MFTNLFSSNGRIGRAEYFTTVILYIGFVSFLRSVNRHHSILLQMAELSLLYILFAQGAKRCHDINNSGWCQLIPFYFLWMVFKEGDNDANDYGISPKHAKVAVRRENTMNSVQDGITESNTVKPVNQTNVSQNVATVVDSVLKHKNSENAQQTILEITNITGSQLQNILKKIRSLQNINSLNYTITGSSALIAVQHNGSTQVLLDDFYKLMPGIAVMDMKTGSIRLKINEL